MSSLALPAPTVRTNGHADYAPPNHPDRLDRLNEATVSGVTTIGKECARQIEAGRQEVKEVYDRLDKYLVELIIATTKYTEFAQKQISTFTATATAAEEAIKAATENIKREMQQ